MQQSSKQLFTAQEYMQKKPYLNYGRVLRQAASSFGWLTDC